MKYILTDIEGTTTSISFVHDILFPYSYKRLESFINENITDQNVLNSLESTKKTALEESQKDITTKEAIELLLYWIKTDRKHPALKNLQGHIWEEGYLNNEIKAHVYEDVAPALVAWTKKGITLGVYSSGSIKAQHLIFEYSNAGNLRPYFSHHFDTGIGHKREKQSYLNIVELLKLPAEEVLFLSDIKEELDAARDAGMKTIQLVRQHDVVTGEHLKVSNFSEIKF